MHFEIFWDNSSKLYIIVTFKIWRKLKNLKERETVLHQQACELFKKTFFTIPERLVENLKKME